MASMVVHLLLLKGSTANPNTLISDVKDATTGQVREHIEKLVETLVGENIDDVIIARLCQHPTCKYQKYFDRFACSLNYIIHCTYRRYLNTI